VVDIAYWRIVVVVVVVRSFVRFAAATTLSDTRFVDWLAGNSRLCR
jgi:hypothetical protein